MKAKLYLFFIFSLFAFTSKGQVSTSFPKDSAQWVNHSYGYVTMDGASYDTLYCYTMKGDTLIGSTNYKKLKMFKSSSFLGTPTLSPELIIGGLRYDSVLNEVYYYDNSTAIEKLAYKFDLSTSDNFVTHYTPQTFDSLIVRTVDSTINFTTRTGVSFSKNVRYLFHDVCTYWSSSQPAILNNIGSTYGFLQHYCPTEINLFELQSFSDLGLGDPPSFSSYEVLLGARTLTNDVQFNVYPSPANDLITLSVKGFSFPATNKVNIYTVMGESVYEKNLNDPNTSIDIHSLKAGIYFIRLNTGNCIFVKKIIKQ